MASMERFQGWTKAIAPLRTLKAALNLDRSSSSGNSASLCFDLATQLPIENILMERKGLEGLCSLTQPLAVTEPPRPTLAMLYVESGGWPALPMAFLANSQMLAAEQVAP